MNVDRATVISTIRAHSGEALAARAERELPDEVDAARHADLLADYGIDARTFGPELGDIAADLGLDDSAGSVA